jgi:2-hydroxy-3-keto-5-methylthiopentenyl-1-phosphate phosphatase
MLPKIAVLCDFDGTIVDVDIGELVLKKFGEGDWQSLDLKLENKEISLEQCLIDQYAMVKVPRQEIIEMISQEKISIRPNFVRLVEYCKKSEHEFVVTTGGIDFCIEYIFKINSLDDLILKIHSGKTFSTSQGLLISFPRLSKDWSTNFKEDLVDHYHDLKYLVAYIGDGSSDYEPSRKADLVFSVEKSKLSKMCNESKIRHIDFNDFEEVISGLERWVVDLPD